MSNAPPSKTGDCENCPEAQAAGQQPGYAHIIYTGGPAHVQYVVMRQLIPPRDPNIVTKYGWPSIRNDGGIEYSDGEMPPTPEGFEAVGSRCFARYGRSAPTRFFALDCRTLGSWRWKPSAATRRQARCT